MAHSYTKTLFRIVERVKDSVGCPIYLHCLMMLCQFVLYFLYLLEDQPYHRGDLRFTFRTTLSSLVNRATPDLEENGVYIPAIVFAILQATLTISIALVLLLPKEERNELSALKRPALVYAGMYARVFIAVGLQLSTETLANFFRYLVHKQDSSSVTASDVGLGVGTALAYAESTAQVLVILLLWNDVFWDSPLPWATFGSETLGVLQQFLAFLNAICSPAGPWPLESVKTYLLLLSFALGVIGLWQPFFGNVAYSAPVMYLHIVLQSFVTGAIPSMVLARSFGEDLDPAVLFCGGGTGIALSLCMVIAVMHHRESVFSREANKKGAKYESYFAFLAYISVRDAESCPVLFKLLDEHRIHCTTKTCPCMCLDSYPGGADSDLEKPETKRRWLRMLGRSTFFRLGEHPCQRLWISHHVVLLLGEDNPYKCIVEVEAAAGQYGNLAMRHVLYQLRKRCKEKIREKFAAQEDSVTCTRVLEAFEQDKEAEELREMMDRSAESALEFWRSLSEKNFAVERFQEKGGRLLMEYRDLQLKARKVFSATHVGDEIMQSYANFVRKVMNHALEETTIIESIRARRHLYCEKGFMNALYEKTATIVVRGNRADSLVVVSANRKLPAVLGYRPEQLIGRTINSILTPDIAKHHDEYVNGYIDNGVKKGYLRFPNLSFAVRRDGFLQPLHATCMLLPRFGAGLHFIALLQDASSERICVWSRSGCIPQKCCFVLSNPAGEVLGVTENCVERFGLAHPQLVVPGQAKSNAPYTMLDLFPELKQPEVVARLDKSEEINATAHTEVITAKMDKEAMQDRSCAAVLARAGTYPVLLSKMIIKHNRAGLEQHVYKVVGLPQPSAPEGGCLPSRTLVPSATRQFQTDTGTMQGDNGGTSGGDLSSVCSSSDVEGGTEYLTKEFRQLKATVTDNSMPGILKIVNASVMLVMILIAVFLGITLHYTQKIINSMDSLSDAIIVSYQRRLEHALCRSEVRTISDIANGIEENVNGTRFAYMQNLLATQLSRLAESENNVQRLDRDLLEANVYETQPLFETETIAVDYSTTTSQLTASIAIYDYVDSSLIFSTAAMKDLKSDFYLMQINGTANTSVGIRYVDQMFYKVIMSGYGNGREVLRSSTYAFKANALDKMRENSSTLKLFIGSTFGLIGLWFVILFPMMIKIHLNKREVLAVYSDMRLTTLSKVIAGCIDYIKGSNRTSAADDQVSERGSSTMTSAPEENVHAAAQPGDSSLIASAGAEEKLEPEEEKESEDIVGKKDEFRKFNLNFVVQVLVLVLFCASLCMYNVYKYVKFTSFVDDGETLADQLVYVAQISQRIADLIGVSKEAWVQGKYIVSSNGTDLILYYLQATLTDSSQLHWAVANPHPALVKLMNDFSTKANSGLLCDFAAANKTACREFWNGILQYGISEGMLAIVHSLVENYLNFAASLLTGKYSNARARTTLMGATLYGSETFMYDYAYITFMKLMASATNELHAYFESQRQSDRNEYIAVAVVIMLLLCTLWVKFLFILNDQMWRTKIVLVFLPSEFLRRIDKHTRDFILAILER